MLYFLSILYFDFYRIFNKERFQIRLLPLYDLETLAENRVKVCNYVKST